MSLSRALSLSLCLVLGGCSAGYESDAPAAATLVVANATLLDPVDGALAATTLLIQGERILAVGSDAPREGIETIDGTGLFVIPGLWDLHTHLTHLGDFAGPLLVAQGVTGVRNMGSKLEEIEELQRRIRGGELLGPRIVHAGPTLNGAQNGAHHRVIATPSEAREAVADLQSKGVDVLKTHNATGRETYFALLAAADEAGLDVVGHVPTSVSPIEACQAGQKSLEHIATIFEGTYLAGFESEMDAFLAMPEWEANAAPALVDCFARQQTLFVPTLRAYEVRAHWASLHDDPDPRLRYLDAAARENWFANPPTEIDRREDVIELRQSLVEVGQDLVARAHAAGAPIGAGTDLAGAKLLPGFDLHREIELLSTAGLTPQEAIRAATRGPGDRSGGAPLTGRLTAGAPADLVLLRADPFAEVGALAEIEAVVVRGRLLDRATLDEILQGLESEGPPALD